MNSKEYRKKINQNSKKILSSKVIFAAIRGEEKALRIVLQYYDRYIDHLASRELYDRCGNIYIYHDPVLKTELQNKLIEGILFMR
jgi:hypothetical protein